MQLVSQFIEVPFKLDFVFSELLLIFVTVMLCVICFKLINSTNLLESIIILSVLSLLLGLSYLLMDAPDVAITETALGACLSTCVFVNAIKIVGENYQRPSMHRTIIAAIICIAFVFALTWVVIDLPNFGTPDSPMHAHLTQYYIENTQKDIAIPSIVAAILASYRGFDTLGETTVILIAGLAVFLISSRQKSDPDA